APRIQDQVVEGLVGRVGPVVPLVAVGLLGHALAGVPALLLEVAPVPVDQSTDGYVLVAGQPDLEGRNLVVRGEPAGHPSLEDHAAPAQELELAVVQRPVHDFVVPRELVQLGERQAARRRFLTKDLSRVDVREPELAFEQAAERGRTRAGKTPDSNDQLPATEALLERLLLLVTQAAQTPAR